MKCEYEGNPENECAGEVKPRRAMTAYHFEGVKNSPEDPNRDINLCEACNEAYREYWQERWDEYWSMVL